MDRSSSVRLTKTVAEKAVARDTRYDLWDLELTGFGLRVEKSGTKTFIIRYRTDGGGRSAPDDSLTVGRFGTLTASKRGGSPRPCWAQPPAVKILPATARRAWREDGVRVARLLRAACYFIQRGIHKGSR